MWPGACPRMRDTEILENLVIYRLPVGAGFKPAPADTETPDRERLRDGGIRELFKTGFVQKKDRSFLVGADCAYP